jgi:phage-related minor tail protein
MASARNLGTLTIDVVAKIGGFTQGLTQSERKLDSFSKRAKQVGAEIGRALTVGFTAAAGIGALVLRNTLEAEKAQAQLAAALKSTAGAAGLTQVQLNDMADELSSLTVIEDDAITSAQALLLTFTKIGGDVFPDAIRAAADMSTALGTDLQGAVTQLGKALNDPLKGITALGRAGVQFSADQKAMIEALVETGRVADAQRLILAELETQFGGSAVAARDTLGGALEALKNTVGNLLEGDTGGNGLQAAKEAVEELNAQLSSAQIKSAFAQSIEDATLKVAGLVGWLVKWDDIAGRLLESADMGAALQGYNESLAGVTNKVGELREEIARLESGGNVPFNEPREEAIARLQEQLRKKQAIVDHFHAQELARIKEHAAAVTAASLGTPMLSGGGDVVTPGSDSWEWGIDPREAAKVSGALRDVTQTQSEYYAELQKIADEERAQAERWSGMVAQLSGPLAEAEHDHKLRLREIEEAGRDAGATSEQIAAAKLQETEAHQKNKAAIEAALNPLQTLLDDMDLELKLLGMTNAERIAELELRRLSVDMTPAEIEAARARIEAKAEEYEALQDQISAMDDFRSSFEDNVAGVLDGSKSITEALKDMVDDFIAQLARMAAQDFAESMFGQPGQSGGGKFGDWLGNFFSMFGGARAGGGPVMSGVPYLVGEQGPELVIPSSSGTVIPAGKTAAMLGGGTVINNFSMPGRYDLRTQAQVSADAGRATQRALARGTA